MEFVTVTFLVTIIFGGWQYGRAERLEDKVIDLETEQVHLIELANSNLKEAKVSAEIANDNQIIANSINDNLAQCVKDLSAFNDSVAVFKAANELSQATIQELEERTAGSTLAQCSIPSWLADEITRDALQN